MDNTDKESMDNEFKKKRLYADGTMGYETPLWFVRSKNSIYYVLGVIEVLLVFRFIFKLLGANPRSGFAAFIYSMTNIFTAPFSGIFNSFTTYGNVAKSVFEPGTIIAMIVYAIVAWGLVRLLRLKVSRDGN